MEEEWREEREAWRAGKLVNHEGTNNCHKLIRKRKRAQKREGKPECGSGRMSKERRKRPWSGGGRNSNLCGFEGAKPESCERSESHARGGSGVRADEVRRQFDCRLTGREKAAAKGFGPCPISGDNSLRDPPVPIPNTEVKPQHADSTWLETAR